MKIGIITIHCSPSYGGSLQSFALYKYLELQGHDTEVIDLLRPTHIEYRHSLHHFWLRSSFVSKLSCVIQSVLHLNLYRTKGKGYNENFVEFNKMVKLGKTYRSVDELYRQPPKYDAYMTGSDQVWNPNQPYITEPYFLTFVRKGAGRKIAYAASVGLSKLSDKEKMLYKRWIEDYDYVAVREQSLQTYLCSFINKPISRVADPSFLLDRDYWKSIAIFPAPQKSYILLFELSHNNELISFCRRLSEQSGLKLIVLGQSEPIIDKIDYEVVNTAGPKEFLGYIANAEMVITDSFHGTVFSIIMESKNFYSYIAPGNKKGSRIIDLLSQYKVEDHLLVPDLKQTWNELSGNCLIKEELDACYHEEQNISRSFLNTSLS